MRKVLSRSLALVLTVCMLMSMCLISVSAYDADFVSSTHTTFSRTTSTIAPGVTQDICYAYATADGKQMVYYVATADVTRDDVIVQTSYKDQYTNKEFGMAKLTEQMAYADELYTDATSDRYISDYYKAVVGVNASFYNMQTGQPSGITYLDGVSIGESSSYPQCFAILKDGTAIVDYTKNINKDDIWQAVAGSQMIVYGGEDVTANASGSYNTDRHSRTCVGVTADGKVVVMSLDGRQEPFSCGGTMHELAQIMLEAGCVAAINLDGGGSTTFASRPEGENDVKVINRPSDGSERSISSGLIIASTVAPSNVFDRAVLTAEEEYVTPDSTVKVTATGVSPAGTAAEIPADVTWQLEDTSMGTVEDGVFTSNGTTGEAVVQMVYDGKVVGETTINVVIPDALVFNQTEIVVPFDKTVTLDMTATYGLNEVKLKGYDVAFSFSDSTIGTVDESTFAFTAGSEGVATSSVVTATLKYGNATATANITLGKGSEVIADFEDGTTQGFCVQHITNYNYMFPGMDVTNATKEEGKVHSGNNSLKVVPDYSNSTEGGYMGTGIGVEEDIIIENALTLGMWIYVPEESEGVRLRACLYNESDTRFTTEFIPIGKASTLYKPNWYYVTFDISKYPYAKIKAGKVFIEFYVADRDDLTNYNYNHLDYNSLNTRLCFYIDDVTVDYSSAVDDRERPTFGSINYADGIMSEAVALKGQTVKSNVISFNTTVKEDTSKVNATGLDVTSAKAYIDGVEVDCTYNNGIMSVADAVLTNGTHIVKFEIADKMGNVAYTDETIVIDAEDSKPTIKMVPKDASLDKILLGSVYYVDLVATDIEEVKKVEVDLDLNNISVWELDHMDVADGFEATYTIDTDDNVATVTITKTGKTTATGENVLVSMPIRTWELPIAPITGGTKVGQVFTYVTFKAGSETWPIDIAVCVERGVLTLTDDTTTTFSGDKVQVDTESYVWDNETKPEGYAEWNGGHDHRVETAQYYAEGATNVATPITLEDKDATCTEDGYTGRTFCEVCNSVVDWGTTIKATGHTYVDVDGVLQCEDCEEPVNGEYEGKWYADGIALTGWADDTYYYVDGVMVTGVKEIDGVYYNFGDNGVCKGKYTGLFTVEGNTYYTIFGALTTGWYSIDVDGTFQYMYFDETTYAAHEGESTIDGLTYTFDENGYMTRGAFVETSGGTRYYVAGKWQLRCWVDLPEGRYWCDGEGYIAYGNYPVRIDATSRVIWYAFGDDGVLDGYSNGLFTSYDGKLAYAENGTVVYGVVAYGDGYIFSSVSGYVTTNTDCYVNSKQDTAILPEGSYASDANGYIIGNGFATIGGYTYYYNNYEKAKGFTKVGDKYYMFNTYSGMMYTDKNMWVSANAYGVEPGTYYFQADGTMYVPDLENGKKEIVNENGTLYLTIDGVVQKNGLFECDGEYYYAKGDGALAVGEVAWVSKTNDLVAKPFYYSFDSEGKMIKTGFMTVPSTGYTYYFQDAVIATGFTKLGDDYYMFNAYSGMMYTNADMWVSTNAYGIAAGTYTFQADGTMYVPDLENGEKEIIEKDGVLYLTIDGVIQKNGLYEYDGEYYCAKVNGALAVDEVVWVSKTNDLVSRPYYYSFDDEGKMIKTGFMTVPSTGYTYYYEDAEIVTGFTKIGDDYYMFNSYSGMMYTNADMWVSTNTYGIAAGTYTFQADGTMYVPDLENGERAIVEKDGVLYLTIDGMIQKNGLYDCDGELYYATSTGALATDSVVYVTTTNDLVDKKFYYAFGADGKMIKTGFMTAPNGYTYYYDDCVLAKGFTKIGDDYYMFNAGSGMMYTDQNMWVSANDYGVKAGSYYFGTDGKMVQ